MIQLVSSESGNITHILHLESGVTGAGNLENFIFQGFQLEEFM